MIRALRPRARPRHETYRPLADVSRKGMVLKITIKQLSSQKLGILEVERIFVSMNSNIFLVNDKRDDERPKRESDLLEVSPRTNVRTQARL
jgi:hypothetical protein